MKGLIIIIELKRRGYDLWYWKGKGEVDFILKNKDNTLTGINIIYTDSINPREINALLEFKENFKEKVLELIILTKKIEKSEHGIKYVPFWKWVLGS